MSYDMTAYVTVDNHLVELGNWNYTYNVGNILRNHGFTMWGAGTTVPALLAAKRLRGVLDAIAIGEVDPNEWPDNGWGGPDTFVPVFTEIVKVLERFPSSTLSVE